MDGKSIILAIKGLGSGHLSGLFLQRLVGNLYKAATLMCGYST